MKYSSVGLLAVILLLQSGMEAIQTDRAHKRGWMLLIRLYDRDSDVAHIHYTRSLQEWGFRERE